MNPEHSPYQQPQAPVRKSHKGLALAFLIGPTALFVGALICGAIAMQLPAASVDEFGMADADSPVKTALNVLAFAFGSIGVLTWLPGVIIGIILLVRKK